MVELANLTAIERHNIQVAHNGEREYHGWGSSPFSSASDARVEYVILGEPVKFHNRRQASA